MSKRVALLTGGGDCPGLNAVIRAVTRRSLDRGYEVVGVREGWRGLVDGKLQPLDDRAISGILPRGGTILGTTRTNPYKIDGGVERVLETLRAPSASTRSSPSAARTRWASRRGCYEEHELPGRRRPEDDRQRPLGDRLHLRLRHGASPIATEAIDRLHTTAESHNRVMVVEVMGRHTGWIARHERHRRRRRRDPHPRAPDHGRGGLRGHPAPARARQGLLHRRRQRGLRARPTRPARSSRSRRRRRPTSSATSAWAASATSLAGEIEERTGYETRVTVLGHVQRGGTPTAARPRPRDALRPQGRRPRPRGALGDDGGPPRRRRRRGPARGRGRRAQDRPARVLRGGEEPSSASGTLSARFRAPPVRSFLVTVAAEGGQRPAPPRARVYL